MNQPASLNARSIHTFAPDRFYRVELCNGGMYFLCIGGQFGLDRGHASGVPGQAAAVMLLAVNEALFRKLKKEELIARDPNQNPESLLGIHPHNFKLLPSEIKQATILPKKWFLSFVRQHYGRLVLDLVNGERQEFHFERPEDLKTALESLSGILGDTLTKKLAWEGGKQQSTKTDS
jgi:hypothetical protein